MQKDEALKLLESHLGKAHVHGDEWSFRCANPQCPSLEKQGKKKLSLNIETQNWHCWVCEISGKSINSLLKKIGSSERIGSFRENLDEFDEVKEKLQNLDKTQLEKEQGKIKIPSHFKPIVTHQDKSSDYFRQALIYLRKRGITYFDMIKYRIHYSTKDYQVLIPSYDIKGQTQIYFIRNIMDSMKKLPEVQKKHIIFNELFINWSEPLVIVEGPFDMITAGDNAIPLLGTSLFSRKEKSKLMKEIVKRGCPVYLALDPDAKEKQMRMADELFKNGVDVYIIELEDGDINEIGRRAFQEKKKTAYKYNEMATIKSLLLNL